MKIKETGLQRSALNRFDLLGADESGLSKAFAYILGKEPSTLYKFLRHIGISCKNTRTNYKNTSIEIERVRRGEGRTDIEIKQKGKYHVIIECKVRKSKVQLQRTQYLNSFEDEPQKVLCFITQKHDFKKQINDNIQVHNVGWINILNLFDSREFENNALVKEFIGFAMKGFKMREHKEILVQDLGKKTEIDRFRKYQIYRRDIIFGSPLYFSPYFTRTAKQPDGEGISYLSKILGVLTLSPKDISNFKDDLYKFSDSDIDLVERWINGVNLDISENITGIFTYFFLAKPLQLNVQLKKDRTKKRGRGKNWIAAMIPKNRCVTFEEFIRRLMKAKMTN